MHVTSQRHPTLQFVEPTVLRIRNMCSTVKVRSVCRRRQKWTSVIFHSGGAIIDKAYLGLVYAVDWGCTTTSRCSRIFLNIHVHSVPRIPLSGRHHRRVNYGHIRPYTPHKHLIDVDTNGLSLRTEVDKCR